jgi:hypothetical protein
MTNIYGMKIDVLKCDKCKTAPMVDTYKIQGEWKGLCRTCLIELTKEVKNG